MALPARQPIQDENDGLGKAAANDNFEIKNVNVAGGSNAKIEGKKIKLEINLPKNKAANDNVEIDQTPNTNISASAPEAKKPTDTASDITDKAPATPPTITPTTPPTESAPNKPKTNNQSQNINQTPDRSNQNQPPQPNNQAPIENEPQTPLNPEENRIPQEQENELPQPEDAQPIADQQTPPNNQQTPQSDQPQNEKTPPLSGDEPKPWRSDANSNADKRLPQQTNTPTNDELSNTGPHSTSDKTPNKIDQTKQRPTASKLSEAKNANGKNASGKANVIAGAANNLADTSRNAVTGVKNIAKNKMGQKASNLESDRSRVKKLKKERKNLGTELNDLEQTVGGLKTNSKMLILKTFAPSIYAQLTSLTFGKANLSDGAKIKVLQTAQVSLYTIKGLLNVLMAIADYTETLINIVKFGAATTEIIIGFFIIILSPIISIPFFIFKYASGTGKISQAIRSIIKDIINPMIDQISLQVQTLNKKIKLRVNIQKINELLASTKSERKENSQQKNNLQKQA